MPASVRSRLQSPRPADVEIRGGFWGRRVEVKRRASVPHVYEMCRTTGRLAAMDVRRPGGRRRPHPFFDSDVAKWLEAAAYCLAANPDAKLKRRVDAVARLFARAQRPDGYLNTYFTQVEPRRRWTNLRDRHELYCAGHLIEAAVAHADATGESTLLDVACRLADHIDATFGRSKRAGYPGHEEIELALVRLYRATAERRYLDLARYFVDARGRRPYFFDAEAKARGDDPADDHHRTYEYCQAHLPVREQRSVVGHAVRAMYLYSAMADLAGETHDAALLAACRRLWDSLTRRRMYVTGGVGPAAANEGFTTDYDLPNDTAYAETCAAVALVFWARRMLELTADAAHADVMERALYNGALAGVSLDGRKFFYGNPLACAASGRTGHRGPPRRQDFFGCACCPPNIARLIASVGTYACAVGDGAVYVHLYAAGVARLRVGDTPVTVCQETDYPWSGDVAVTVTPAQPADFALNLRIPDWCRTHSVRLNGKPVRPRIVKGYARIRRRWSPGDTVALSLAMPVERIAADPNVRAAAGKVALQRGPIVYCLEQPDHAADVHSILLPDSSKLTARFDARLLGGVTVVEAAARAASPAGWRGRLYRPANDTKTVRARIRAIPYFAWANRKAGAMTVWIPRT